MAALAEVTQLERPKFSGSHPSWGVLLQSWVQLCNKVHVTALLLPGSRNPNGGPRIRSLLERFEAMYIPTSDCGCWLWMGAISRVVKHPVYDIGYGSISMGPGQPIIGSHVASWLLFRGPLPEGHEVCHK